MRKLATLLFICCSQLGFSQIDTITLSSKISDVTVFFSGAQVTRTGKVQLQKGKHTFLIDRLPLGINAQSIQVMGNSDVQILSVKHQTNYKDQGKNSPKSKAIYKKIELQKIAMKSINNQIQVQQIEEKFLLDNSRLSNQDRNISVEELSKAATFYKTRINEIRKTKLDLLVSLKDMQEALEDMYTALNQKVVDDRKTYSQIMITVDCKKYTTKPIKFSYLVETAGWEPLYDFRVKDVSHPLKIVYNANIFQSTGEDWKDVNVTLSSGNPNHSSDVPQLERYFVGQQQQKTTRMPMKGNAAITGRVFEYDSGEPIPFANVTVYRGNDQIAATTTDFDGLYTIKPLPLGTFSVKVTYVGYSPKTSNVSLRANSMAIQDVALNKGIELEEVVIYKKEGLFERDKSTTSKTISRSEITQMAVRSNAGLSNVRGNRKGSRVQFIDGVKVVGNTEINLISNSLKKSVAQLEFKIDIPYTILSDGEDYNLKIKEVSTPADYVYLAVPKLDEDAFLTAEITEWNELNLLSGKTSIFYEGTFVSEAFLDIENADDTLNVSLGRDKNIMIKRTLDKQNYSKRSFGKNVNESVAWKIEVKNMKNAPISIQIEDQIPLTNRDEYKVEVESTSQGKLDKDSGSVTWKLDLKPQEKKELELKYTVQYPKYSNF